MIHQCYHHESQVGRLFNTPVYQGFGLEPSVNPDLTRNCPELADERNRTFLSEYAAMLYFWRNPERDPDPWIGFTSYRQTDKCATIFTDRQTLEGLLATADVVGWGQHRFVAPASQRQITLMEQGEWTHKGITMLLWRLLMMRDEPLPLNYLTASEGLFANYWAMSKANFDDYMRWSYPLILWCLRHPEEPFIASHRRSIGYLAERLFICWYGLRNKRLVQVGETRTDFTHNTYHDPLALSTTPPVPQEQFITLSSWNANLAEFCHRHRAEPHGIIHVGAHYGEEREIYRRLGASQVLWIEADPNSMDQLRANLSAYAGNRAIQACLAEVDGRRTPFYRTNNRGESSSILPMGTHAEQFKEVQVVDQTILETKTFASLVRDEGLSLEGYDFLVMDIQGAELLALKGFGDHLHRFKAVYIEVNLDELYKGCARLPEIDAYLHQFSFSRREVLVTAQRYGDAFYLRDGAFPLPPPDLRQRLQSTGRQLLATRNFIYKRVGHDQRLLELLDGGKVGQGIGPHEQVWLLRVAGHEIVLEFIGAHGRTSCLCLFPDGFWRGGYLLRPDVPVEMFPANLPAPSRRGYPFETNIPLDLADTLRNALNLRTFVETGTRLGVTTRVMAPRFASVYTVELEPNTYYRTAASLAPLTNVRCILGDSTHELPKILREAGDRCMLWLDAHWSGGDTGKGATECPVLEELAAAYTHRPDHVVMIDDARLFLAPPPPPHQPLDWPSYAAITTFLARQTPAPFVRVVGDVIVAGPPEIGPVVEAFCQQRNL